MGIGNVLPRGVAVSAYHRQAAKRKKASKTHWRSSRHTWFFQGNRISLAGEHNNSSHFNHHPTVKPLHLMAWLVKLVSKEGDVVLDPFMGSGTTLMATKMLRRKGIGVELEHKYCDIAIRRINSDPYPLITTRPNLVHPNPQPSSPLSPNIFANPIKRSSPACFLFIPSINRTRLQPAIRARVFLFLS